jgi:hypothetical protein
MNKQTALFLAATLPLLAQPSLRDPAPKHLIAFMGDSFAAGEGAPSTTGGPKWVSEPCHRSEENGRARVAELLGALVPNRTVLTANGLRTVDDFQTKDVSCTGATITSGILGPYSGISRMRPEGPGPNFVQKPQIEQIETWMAEAPRNRQSIDTLVISIGGNDVGFAQIISTCMNPLEGDCNENDHLRSVMENGNFYMPHLIGYNRLRSAFLDMERQIRERLNPKRVILVGYPTGSRDEHGKLCDNFDENFHILPNGDGYVPSNFGGATAHVTADESLFIETSLISRINRERKEIATELGWQFVDIQSFTKTHGYCAAKPWFNTPKTAFAKQGDFNGTAHPNATGYKVYENFLLREIARAHDIRINHPVTGAHEQFSYILTKRSGGTLTGNLSTSFGGFPYNLMHQRDFTAQMKYLLNPNPNVITEIRMEVSSIDFEFNPPANAIRTIIPATGLDQDGMLRADFTTNQYVDNDLIFVRWRIKHVPFWNTTAAPVTSYSTVAKFRVKHPVLPIVPVE